jgi:hypothetical protein
MTATALKTRAAAKAAHPWLRALRLSYQPGATTPALDDFTAQLLEAFDRLGHSVQAEPDDDTDVLLTTAPFGAPLGWREAMLFTARRKFKLARLPVVITLVHVTPDELDSRLAHFERALAKEPHDERDFAFDGLSARAHRVLIEQGLRGGPILSLMRLIQAQVKSIRVLLAVGDERIERVYHFDLVGAYPASDRQALGDEGFLEDIVLRLATTESTREITDHEVAGEPISQSQWKDLTAPEAMRRAGRELGKRSFFTEMIRIEDLVHVPAVADAVADQYSEGCFATWEPEIGALIATITGSARPVDKENITDDELAVIVGVKPDGSGAQVRRVEGKRNDPPSSEAVEMKDMDYPLPQIILGREWDTAGEVPIIRSKLHGHRGVRAFDPKLVEYVPLDLPFYNYLVSCATEAQARGIKAAFSRAACLLNLDDPRQVAFTVLPGHGVVIAEKWVAGKAPFQLLWELMDSGGLEIDKHIPQGPMSYEPAGDGRMGLRE